MWVFVGVRGVTIWLNHAPGTTWQGEEEKNYWPIKNDSGAVTFVNLTFTFYLHVICPFIHSTHNIWDLHVHTFPPFLGLITYLFPNVLLEPTNQSSCPFHQRHKAFLVIITNTNAIIII